jgi:hypothetical protein
MDTLAASVLRKTRKMYRPQINIKIVAYRPVAKQRLGKHVTVARQQIINKATVGLQEWKRSVFYVVRTERL